MLVGDTLRRRHVVVALLLTFFLVVGGIMVLIAGLRGSDSGLDTDTPNGHSAIGRPVALS